MELKVLEEKLRVTEKDIDGLKDDMCTIEEEVKKISTTVTIMNERQEEMSRDIKIFNTNGGPARCHERQILLDSMATTIGKNSMDISALVKSVTMLETQCQLSKQSIKTTTGIQLWILEIIKSIVIAVVISLVIATLTKSGDTKEITKNHENSTVQVR